MFSVVTYFTVCLALLLILFSRTAHKLGHRTARFEFLIELRQAIENIQGCDPVSLAQ
jgi:hypothetical protein